MQALPIASAVPPPVRTAGHSLIGGNRARPAERRSRGVNPATAYAERGRHAKCARPDVEQPMIEDELTGRGEAPGNPGAHPIPQVR